MKVTIGITSPDGAIWKFDIDPETMPPTTPPGSVEAHPVPSADQPVEVVARTLFGQWPLPAEVALAKDAPAFDAKKSLLKRLGYRFDRTSKSWHQNGQ